MIILQYIHVSDHPIVHLKFMQCQLYLGKAGEKDKTYSFFLGWSNPLETLYAENELRVPTLSVCNSKLKLYLVIKQMKESKTK